MSCCSCSQKGRAYHLMCVPSCLSSIPTKHRKRRNTWNILLYGLLDLEKVKYQCGLNIGGTHALGTYVPLTRPHCPVSPSRSARSTLLTAHAINPPTPATHVHSNHNSLAGAHKITNLIYTNYHLNTTQH